MKNSFIFYRSFITGTEELNDADFRILIRAIASYALDGKEPELSGVLKMLFEFARPNIDFSNKKQRDGAKGGRPKTTGKTTGLTTGLSDSDSDSDSDKDSDSDGDVERECEGETPTPPATPQRKRQKKTDHGFSTSNEYNYDQIIEQNRQRMMEKVVSLNEAAKEARH